MYYEINVAYQTPRDGKWQHLFATAERSLTDEAAAKTLYTILCQKFPAPTFQVTVSQWQKTGKDLIWVPA